MGEQVRVCSVLGCKKPVRLERELDSMRIGTMKLYVNLPKYAKGGDRATKERY